MSQLNFEKKEIDGHNYEMYMLEPMTSNFLLLDVAKMIGPAIGPIIDTVLSVASDKQNIMDLELGTDFFTRAANSLFTGLEKTIVEKVIKTFRDVTFVDGKKLEPIFNIHFLGKLDSMYKWLAWGMQVQWGKSLNALVSALPVQNALKKTEASPSQNT